METFDDGVSLELDTIIGEKFVLDVGGEVTMNLEELRFELIGVLSPFTMVTPGCFHTGLHEDGDIVFVVMLLLVVV